MDRDVSKLGKRSGRILSTMIGLEKRAIPRQEQKLALLSAERSPADGFQIGSLRRGWYEMFEQSSDNQPTVPSSFSPTTRIAHEARWR